MTKEEIKNQIRQKLETYDKGVLVNILTEYLYLQTLQYNGVMTAKNQFVENSQRINQQFSECSQTLNDFEKQFMKK